MISTGATIVLLLSSACACFAQPVQPAKVIVPRANIPSPGETVVRSVTQQVDGRVYHLRGAAVVETSQSILRADEIDYDDDSGEAEARGNVSYQNFESGEKLEAGRAEYNLREETGRFYEVRGSAPPPPQSQPRQALLVSTSPFYFQGDWAERIGNRYVLHQGFITNCRLPNPWWTLRGRKFDIVPGDRAIAHKAVFRLRRVPLFYTPYFYKSLKMEPRKSGFLIPNIGNSSQRGKMVGAGYYWAFNRSYDLTYRSQLFTQRGFAHHVDVRGKPREGWDFNAIVYGVNDRGLERKGGERLKQGGFLLTFDGVADLGRGFTARGEVNYLSSFVFRQAFTESFNEAVFAEVHSIGFITKHWSTYGLNLVLERNENYQTTEPGDRIVIRRLPAFEFNSRDREVLHGKSPLPLWVSLESSAALVRRNQPLFQTRQFVERLDLAPRVSTALRWKDFHLLPSFSVRETHYGSSRGEEGISGRGLLRSAGEFSLDLVPPSLARVYNAPRWLGDKLKHVIEPRAGFRYVDGIQDFQQFIRFDDTELLSNTKELDLSITNRFYVKRGTQVNEVLSWQVWQRRYFDPDFGGALIGGTRNVLLSQTQMTGYAFLDGPRHYSPLVSAVRLNPIPTLGVEWRSDYDPMRNRFTNSSLQANVRFTEYFVSLGHNHVRSVPRLSPNANQLLALIGWGKPDRRGWGAGFSTVYDFRLGIMQFTTTQVSYNSDCCGLSFQYRRFSFGTRNENQFRVAFAVANIGSFGTLRLQERLF